MDSYMDNPKGQTESISAHFVTGTSLIMSFLLPALFHLLTNKTVSVIMGVDYFYFRNILQF